MNLLIVRFDDLNDYLEIGESAEVSYVGDKDFFSVVSQFPELHGKILDFIDLAIVSRGAWLSDEVPEGLFAAYSLAMYDQRYIPKYVELLRVVDNDHELHQHDQIRNIVDKWGDYDNTLYLLAVRCVTARGQTGVKTTLN